MDIVTDRLRLRQLQAEDAAWLTQEIANPKVQRWLTSPPHPYTLADAEEFIALFKDSASYRLITADGKPLGVVSLTAETEEMPDLGYWLAEHAWGQGYMTEAVRAMLDWHFANFAKDVSSGWIKGNEASRNVLTKLGFVANGEKQARAEFFDAIVTVEKVLMTCARWQDLSAAH